MMHTRTGRLDVLMLVFIWLLPALLWYPFWWLGDLYRAAVWDHIDKEMAEDPPRLGLALAAAVTIAAGAAGPFVMNYMKAELWESVAIVAIALLFYIVITRERDKE